ncbi:molecular chaperone SurA [Betaproteobacteria bacterium SCN2]|jgi:peptidyl-prolyl cis-trans isomerase SurA|nr:molecular chaperone SurA [Betaproteobacteria bacterium SCN2]
MNFFSNKFLAGFVLACCAGLAQAAPSIIEVDQIAAVVNDEVITRSELEQRYQTAMQQLRRQNIQMPPRNLLLAQTLERMITERALLQHAKSTGIRVDPLQIDRAIQRIASQNGMNVDELRAALARDGISFERFRENIVNEILVTRARERQVESKLNVSDAEIDSYLQTQSSLDQGDEFNISHILVAVPENASPEQIQERRARAQNIIDELNKGADFAQLSATYSDAPNALDGGGLGWRNAGQIPELFMNALRGMQAGAVSEPVKSPNGFHILRLNDRRGMNTTTVVTQTRVRHILIKPSEITSEADAINRLNQVRERIEHGGEKFETLARQFSEDTGSAAKGGELSWVNPGDTVPEFERAMNALKPGELSQIVQSPFGWHLIEVMERRQQDVTTERQRLLARQAIRERKLDEAVEDWVRQVRDQAYVELRPLD